MQHTSRQSSLEEISMKQEMLSQKEDLIKCLQEELVKVRLREAENDALIRDLRARIQELEEVWSRLLYCFMLHFICTVWLLLNVTDI
jgi:hypothetical protein